MSERMVSDIGGLPAGEIPKEDRRLFFWERQMLAMFNELQARKLVTRDEERRALEEMSGAYHKRSGHYQRRLDGMLRLLAEKGVVNADDVEKRTREILARGTRDA
jgi:nitrile hydratase subunit beta